MHFTVMAVQARSKYTVLFYNNNSGRQLISKTTSTFRSSSEYLMISKFCSSTWSPGKCGRTRTHTHSHNMKNIRFHFILLCTRTDYSLDTNWISSSRLHQSTFIITHSVENCTNSVSVFVSMQLSLIKSNVDILQRLQVINLVHPCSNPSVTTLAAFP